MNTFLIALRTTLVTLVLTGIVYPLAITGMAQVVFPHRANGSIVTDDKGNEVGSELIAQGFTGAAYLHPRPSAAGYDATASAGTNLAVTSAKLRDEATALAATYRADNGVGSATELPVDAIARSASGLDPDITPDNAALQAARIAKARDVAVDRVQAVIAHYTAGRDLGLFGEPRVNVVAVNLALDRTFGRPAHVAVDGKM